MTEREPRDCWLALLMLDEETVVGVRGGLTTGHWTRDEAEQVATRLSAEVAGRSLGTLTLETWELLVKARSDFGEPVTVGQFFDMVMPKQEAERSREQYTNDPMVTGKGLGV